MSKRLVPILTAAGIGRLKLSEPLELTAGIVSGVYIWNEPLQQATGLRPAPEGTTPVIDWQAHNKEKEQEKVDERKAQEKPKDVDAVAKGPVGSSAPTPAAEQV